MPRQECVLCAHDTTLEHCLSLIRSTFPRAAVMHIPLEDGVMIGVGLVQMLDNSPNIKIRFRERLNPSYTLERVECAVTQRLAGLMNFADMVPTDNEQLRYLLKRKIVTLNYELSFQSEEDFHDTMQVLVTAMNKDLDGVVFAFAGTVVNPSDADALLDADMKLIFDLAGRSKVDQLKVLISHRFYKPVQFESTPESADRKKRSIAILQQKGLQYIDHLPELTRGELTTLRTAEEITERLVALWIVMLVSFKQAAPDNLLAFLEKYELSHVLTPEERAFLQDPTEEARSTNTWKCECIWLLMWAIKAVDALPFPDGMIRIDDIPMQHVPVLPKTDPRDFIRSHNTIRSKEEILDAADLYYRINWLGRNNGIKGIQSEGFLPAVAYERYYALNWLRCFENSPWDEVDTPS